MSLVSRPVWIFLAGRCFSSKTVDSGGWICLDFLGFSRPNPVFSIGYADKAHKNFYRRSGGLRSARERRTRCERPELFMGASVIRFLVFCKNLSALVAIAVD